MSTAGTTRIINIVLAVGPTSPSPRQVHNILGREGRDLLWLLSRPPLFFSLLLTEISGKKASLQHATCAPRLGDRCIFDLANERAEHQHQQLVKNGNHFVRDQTAAPAASQSLRGFGISHLKSWQCSSVKYVLYVKKKKAVFITANPGTTLHYSIKEFLFFLITQWIPLILQEL